MTPTLKQKPTPPRCACCGFQAADASELTKSGECLDCAEGRHQKDCKVKSEQLPLGQPAPAQEPPKANGNAPATAVATTGGQGVATQPKTKLEGVRNFLEKMQGNLTAVLPRHLTAERMIKVALVSCAKTPKLLDCTSQSMAAAMMQAAELGLEPGGALGHAYLVPFKNQVQFIPGYRGLIELARRSGEIAQIGAWPVFKGEAFEYTNTDEGQKLTHVPNFESSRSAENLTHVYMIARLKGEDLPQIEVMSRAEVEAVRARSKAANAGPWVTDFVEMARKTVVKRGIKYLPLSSEKFEKLAQAIEISNRAERDEIDLEVLPEQEDDADMPQRASEAAAQGAPAEDPKEAAS